MTQDRDRSKGGKWEHAVSPLQRARHQRRWSQDTACLVIRQSCPGHHGHPCHLEASKLSEYENGKRPPSLVHIKALCEAYQASAEDLGLIAWHRRGRTTHSTNKPSNVPYQTDGVYPDRDLESLVLTLRGDDLTQFAPPAREAEGNAVQRNTFLKGMGAVAGAAATDPFIRLTEIDRAALNTTTVSGTALESLEQAAYVHGRGFYELHRPGHVEALVNDWSAAGRLLHQSMTPSQRIRLMESYARLSGVLGHYSYDNGHNARALALFASGKEAAREAGNNDLLAWLYDRHAEVYNYRGNPRVRAALVEKGLEAAGHTETLTVARLHGTAACAYAAVGNPRWAAAHREESARILAKGIAGCWPSDRSMPRGYSFTPDALVSYTARSHLELGEHAKAITFYRETLAQKEQLGLSASTVAALALNRIHLASAQVRTGDLEEATHTGTIALQGLTTVAKPLVLGRAHEFAAELTAADTGGSYARGFSEFLREQAPPPA